MYSELIYTRCGEGIDILRGRNPIKNSGFKVFSCSENVTEAGFTDLPFLYATAQSKEPYADPSFMDDAYLFVVPDLGGKYLLNFHPIPFNRTATGDYSHRPGNFINQIFIGQFDDIYPYELFGNESVWDAQKRGEAFYYENSPTPLAQRDDLGETIGYINFDDIAAFVAEGRREALMGAIAFIIAQYSLPPEKRKFLVIRDEHSKLIELWIAAIESAFSPRMAAGLSFATRLDKFANANKYTVNLSGQYQTQINLQSPNQKLRFRAMIVGVDERDRTSAAAAKALANSPYVVLDGKTKTLSVDVDTSNPYYRYVTTYDEGHEYLCRQFMQMVDVASPSGDVLRLYSAFVSLSRYSSSKQLKDLLTSLSILGQYKLKNTSDLERLYREIKQDIPRFLKEDAVSSFAIMRWLDLAAAVIGDEPVSETFRDAVCRSYADNIYMRPQSESTMDLQNAIKKSGFAQSAYDHIILRTTVGAYANAIHAYKPADWVSFTGFFIEALKVYRGASFPESVKILLPDSINALYQARDGQNAVRVASLYAALNQGQTIDIILTDASSTTDQNYIAFLVLLVCKIAPETISTESDLTRLYEQLQQFNLDSHFSAVLAYKAQALVHTQDMERFLDWIQSNRELKSINMTSVIRIFDKNIVLSDKAAKSLASRIQSCRTENVPCINSAHIYALDALDDRKLASGLIPLLNSMISQGFPSIKDEAYAERLVGKLYSGRLPEGAFTTIVTAASNSPYYSALIAEKAMQYIGTRQDSVIGEVIDTAVQTNSRTLFDALVNACANIKQFDKGMSAIRGTLRSKAALQYFALIEKNARTLHDQKKEQSLFGRLFSRGSFNDSDSWKWGKK